MRICNRRVSPSLEGLGDLPPGSDLDVKSE